MKRLVLLALVLGCTRTAVVKDQKPAQAEDVTIGQENRNIRDDDPALGRDEQIEQRITGDEGADPSGQGQPKEPVKAPQSVDAEPTPAVSP